MHTYILVVGAVDEREDTVVDVFHQQGHRGDSILLVLADSVWSDGGRTNTDLEMV